MNIVPKAGALVLTKENGILKILLLFREKHQDWTFTKGHIDPGENAREAAIREVKEETGLDITLLSELPDLRYVLPRGDLAHVHVFIGTIIGNNELFTEYAGDKLKWHTITDAIKQLTHANLRDYLQNISPILMNTSL